jgi:hypothetical protein
LWKFRFFYLTDWKGLPAAIYLSLFLSSVHLSCSIPAGRLIQLRLFQLSSLVGSALVPKSLQLDTKRGIRVVDMDGGI